MAKIRLAPQRGDYRLPSTIVLVTVIVATVLLATSARTKVPRKLMDGGDAGELMKSIHTQGSGSVDPSSMGGSGGGGDVGAAGSGGAGSSPGSNTATDAAGSGPAAAAGEAAASAGGPGATAEEGAGDESAAGRAGTAGDAQALAEGLRTEPGPWREPRPLLDEGANPWPGDTALKILQSSCAYVNCRRVDADCPHTDTTSCAAWLRGLLEFTGWLFTKHNIKFAMTGGTLIAAAREHFVHPWDKDVDVHVESKGWDLLNAPNNKTTDISLRQEAWKYGFILKPWSGGWVISRLCYHPAHPDLQGSDPTKEPGKEGQIMPWLDLFEAEPEDEPDVYNLDSGEPDPGGVAHDMPHVEMTGTRLFEISDMWLPGLDDAEAYLKKYYGPNWTTPKIAGHGVHP